MHLLKKIATIAVCAIALIAVLPTPAQASVSDCPYGTVCIWDDSFGVMLDSYWSGPGTCHNLNSADNDKANSFYNRLSTRHVQFYRDANCTGTLLRDWNGSTGPFAAGYYS